MQYESNRQPRGRRNETGASCRRGTTETTVPGDTDTPTDDEDDGSGGSPGLGVVGTLSALAGGGYLLSRDGEGDDGEE